jgi:hypothetical protein
MSTKDAGTAAALISSLYERHGNPAEDAHRASIARGLDAELGPAVGEPGKVRIEIVHKNPPAGTSANVTSSPNVETEMKTDRQQAPLGDQYAYSPGNF